jgi:hypothetical protein
MIEKLIGIFKSQKTNNVSQSSTSGNNTSQQQRQSGFLNKQNIVTIINTPQPTWAEQNQAAKNILDAGNSYLYSLRNFTQNYSKFILEEHLFKAKKNFEKTIDENLSKLQENDQKIIKNKINSMLCINETEIDSKLPQIINDVEYLKSVLAKYLDT